MYRVALTVLLFGLFSNALSAQVTFTTPPKVNAPPPASKNPQAVNLLNQVRAALTGVGANIGDITLTGSVRRVVGSNDETGTAVFTALASGEARLDLAFASGQRSEVHANSTTGPKGAWSGPDGTQKPIPLFNLLVDSAWCAPALMFSKLTASSDVIPSAVSTETLDGETVEHLTIVKQFPQARALVASMMQQNSRMEIYVASATSLPIALTYNLHPNNDAGRDVPTEIRFADYRTVSGTQVPFHIQQYLNNSLVLDLQIQSVSLNTGLNVNAFSVPDWEVSAPVIPSKSAQPK